MPKGKRKRILVSEDDERTIVQALDDWAETDDFIAQRTRAFAYLLWDGAVRTKAALDLNIEEVVGKGKRLAIVQEVVQRPSDGNRFRQQRYFLSERTRKAFADYLGLIEQDGWLPEGKREGPLFLSSYNRGSGKRASSRSMIHNWYSFLSEHTEVETEYQLDDVVYTGRMAFLDAADGDSNALSEHASITKEAAGAYVPDAKSRPKDIMARLHKKP